MLIETFPVGPLQCNCSIMVCETTRSAIVVDPGGDWPLIRSRCEALKAKPEYVIHTHAHIDHVGATQDVREHFKCSCGFHKGESWLIDHLAIQAMMLPIPYRNVTDVDQWLNDGQTLRWGAGLSLDVCHTPGHTPGSLSFLVRENDKAHSIISGDTLFREGIGRSDLWGGNHELLMDSITTKLMSWPVSIPVIPGHGPNTTLEHEQEYNPFLTE